MINTKEISKSTLSNLRAKIHKEALHIRNIEHIINRTVFEDAFLAADKDDQERLNEAVTKYDLTKIRLVIKRLTNTELELMSLVELRNIAAKLGIRNYTKYSKSILLSILKEREKYEKSRIC